MKCGGGKIESIMSPLKNYITVCFRGSKRQVFQQVLPQAIYSFSTKPRSQKSFTTINTAISLTKSDAKVVLIDADMRWPRIHGIFSNSSKIGPSTFLCCPQFF